MLTQAEVSWARERLDELAEAVRAEHPDMYDEYGQLPAAAADGGEAAHSRCLVDLRKVLFQDQGNHPTPTLAPYEESACVRCDSQRGFCFRNLLPGDWSCDEPPTRGESLRNPN